MSNLVKIAEGVLTSCLAVKKFSLLQMTAAKKSVKLSMRQPEISDVKNY